MKTDFTQLIPELNEWNNDKGIDVGSWIGCVGDFQKAIGYSTIFWPDFVEVEGCIVREGVSRENVIEWIAKYTEPSRAEETINHLHLDGLQYMGCEDISSERLSYLGRILKDIYACKLKRDFPDKTFVVKFDEPEDKQDFTHYILTFYQAEQNKKMQATPSDAPAS